MTDSSQEGIVRVICQETEKVVRVIVFLDEREDLDSHN
jgi:hypothetical protein